MKIKTSAMIRTPTKAIIGRGRTEYEFEDAYLSFKERGSPDLLIYRKTADPKVSLKDKKTLLDKLKQKGVTIVHVTLHVGYGTFSPVKEEYVENHAMHEEFYQITEDAAEIINSAKREGNRVVACGTTSVRALESAVDRTGSVQAKGERTDIFIYPPYEFKVVDALITNFHFPKSTLLMLVSAFAGRKRILNAY